MQELSKSTAEKVFEYIQWGFIILFAVPTVLIMASWKSLPGQPMYEVKRSFEQVLLFVVKPSYAAEASLNVQYTQRRFNEAKVLLANDQSMQGLTYLSQQIRATKAVIERAPSKTKQKEIAQSYIKTLRAVSQELEIQKQAGLAQQIGRPGVVYQPPQPTVTPRLVPTWGGQPVIPTPTPIEQPGTPEEEIDNVQEEIEETIEQLEQLAAALNADANEEEAAENNQPFVLPTSIPQGTLDKIKDGNDDKNKGKNGSNHGNSNNGNRNNDDDDDDDDDD